MSPVFVEGIGTMATDRHWRLYIDPRALETWSIPEVGAVLIHEAHHLIRSHADRSLQLGVGVREHKRFNVAADFEINDDLRELPLPGGKLDPRDFGFATGELAETYFLLLATNEVNVGVECGSGAHGVAQPWELAAGSGPSVEPIERDLIRQQVAREIRSAANSGGTIPGGLERWAHAFLQPRVNWRRELGTFVRSGIDAVSGAVDYSYKRPSRRIGTPLGRDVLLPALIQPAPRIAVVVDTSASMSESNLLQALAEIHGILRSCGVANQRLKVLACDSAVRSTQTVFSARQVTLRGGGGTDMAAGLDAASALRPKPEMVIVVTDGFTPWPTRPNIPRVIVAILGEGPEPPAWSRFVRIPIIDA
jgi:predicted metal-dependent peptidase